MKEILVDAARDIQPPVECVVGLDSRGFLFAPLLSLELNVPFVPIRKKHKLPGAVVSFEYEKEYGKVGFIFGLVHKMLRKRNNSK